MAERSGVAVSALRFLRGQGPDHSGVPTAAMPLPPRRAASAGLHLGGPAGGAAPDEIRAGSTAAADNASPWGGEWAAFGVLAADARRAHPPARGCATTSTRASAAVACRLRPPAPCTTPTPAGPRPRFGTRPEPLRLPAPAPPCRVLSPVADRCRPPGGGSRRGRRGGRSPRSCAGGSSAGEVLARAPAALATDGCSRSPPGSTAAAGHRRPS